MCVWGKFVNIVASSTPHGHFFKGNESRQKIDEISVFLIIGPLSRGISLDNNWWIKGSRFVLYFLFIQKTNEKIYFAVVCWCDSSNAKKLFMMFIYLEDYVLCLVFSNTRAKELK